MSYFARHRRPGCHHVAIFAVAVAVAVGMASTASSGFDEFADLAVAGDTNVIDLDAG